MSSGVGGAAATDLAGDGRRLLAVLAGQADVLARLQRGLPLADALAELRALAAAHGGDDPASAAIHAALAQTAATAEERDRERRTAAAVDDVARAIGARLDLEEIVQIATDAATELTRAQFGAFFYNVVRDDGEAYTLYTISGVPRARFERFPMPRNTHVFAPTFDGDGTVRMADVTVDPRFGRNDPYFGMPEGHLPVRSYLAVPVITSDGGVAGGLFFGHADVGVFDGEAERLAEGIAAHAAIAIENARLYAAAQRELARRHEAFEQRDQVARTLQASLLPPHLPAVPGLDVAADYRPAGKGVEVVGDFYAVFAHGPERWALVIGDVCGKGIDAAKLTALARHTIRGAAMHCESPADVLRTLNEAARAEAATDGLLMTALYADLDLRGPAPVARISAAGHPPAFVRAPDGTVRTTRHHGPMLGGFRSVDLVVEEVALEPGSVLLLVTDGVVEARAGGELFGEQRLAAVLAEAGDSARGVVEAVAAAVVEHAGERLADDVAVLALRVPA